MRVTLVRHGETTGQSSIRYYGRTDLPLSELGVRQMHRVRAALDGERFDAVFSSRLERSRTGAQLIAPNPDLVTAIAAFDEVDFGRWEGWTREEIERQDPDNFRRWQADSRSFTYPEGESRPAFEARIAAGLEELLGTLRVENVLMVLHRGVIAVILTRLLRLTAEARARLGIDLASIHVVTGRDTDWEPELLDRTDHLSDDGAHGGKTKTNPLELTSSGDAHRSDGADGAHGGKTKTKPLELTSSGDAHRSDGADGAHGGKTKTNPLR